MSEIDRRILQVRSNIAAAAAQAGRSAGDVLLCAVSKTQTPEAVSIAAALDVDLFGENRVQELKDKYDVGVYGTKPCHLIGHLQTNKVKYAVGRADVIQSVDSMKLLDEIDSEAGKKGIVQKIMLEINIAQEESKNGISRAEIDNMIEKICTCGNILLCGLMTIPPISEKNGQNRIFFSTLRELFIDIKTKKYDNVNMEFLSMGMSGDYEDAILEGANIVRIGTAIFGKRI